MNGEVSPLLPFRGVRVTLSRSHFFSKPSDWVATAMAGEPVAGDAAGSHCGLANLGCGVVHALLSSGATCGATLDERERSGALENGLRPLPSHHSHPQRKPRLRRGTLNKCAAQRLADRSRRARSDGVVMEVGDVPEDLGLRRVH